MKDYRDLKFVAILASWKGNSGWGGCLSCYLQHKAERKMFPVDMCNDKLPTIYRDVALDSEISPPIVRNKWF